MASGSVLLVSVSHEMTKSGPTGRKLIGPASAALFRERIIPQLDASSVLFPEGAWERDVITPSRGKYLGIIRKVFPGLEASDKRPLICLNDARASLSDGAQRKYIENMVTLFTFCARHIRLATQPQTMDEAVRMLKEGDTAHTMLMDPPEKLKSVAREILRMNAEWNAAMIRRIESFSARGHSCFCIAGSAHCFALHARTQWPVDNIFHLTTPRELEDFYRGVLTVNVFARTIRGF